MNNKNRRRSEKPLIVLNDHAEHNVLALLANLILTQAEFDAGMVSKMREMGKHPLTPDMLGGDRWQVARIILRILGAMAAEKVPATEKAVLDRLLPHTLLIGEVHAIYNS